jgi:hypothetical protein
VSQGHTGRDGAVGHCGAARKGRSAELEKDVFSGERTQPSIDNKGLSSICVHKTNCFLHAKMAKRTQNCGHLAALTPTFSPEKRPRLGLRGYMLHQKRAPTELRPGNSRTL